MSLFLKVPSNRITAINYFASIDLFPFAVTHLLILLLLIKLKVARFVRQLCYGMDDLNYPVT
jgi:hypothetical protein